MSGAIEDLEKAALKGFAKAVEAGTKAGADVLEFLYASSPAALGEMVEWVEERTGGCGCEIPAPCWMPRTLREVVSYGKAGDETRIVFEVTNVSMAAREVTLTTTTASAAVTFGPHLVVLGAMERGFLEVTYKIPAVLPKVGVEVLLWVKGCRLYFLRWKIMPGLISANTSFEVCVRDEADYLHHWYDHFYCRRPCLQEDRVPGR
jgi:hypothetical protein